MEFSRVSAFFYVLLLKITFVIPLAFLCAVNKPKNRSVVPADVHVCGFVQTLHTSSY